MVSEAVEHGLSIVLDVEYVQQAMSGLVSGYVEDDSECVEDDLDAPAGGEINHVTPARTPLEQVNPGSWEVVPHAVRHTRQTVGAIVRQMELHHFPRGKAPLGQGPVFNLTGAGEILEKSRFFLVVGRTVDRIIECPIFTYGVTGLCDRERDTWPEYCSIRSLGVPVEGFINQSPNNEVLDVGLVKGRFQMKRTAVVRLSELRYRDDNTGVTVVAAISTEALRYATRKVIDLMSEAVMTARQ